MQTVVSSFGVFVYYYYYYCCCCYVFPLSESFNQFSIYIFIYSSYQKDKRAKPGILTKSSALSEVGERWMDKEFHFFCKGLKLYVAGSMLRSWYYRSWS